MLDDYKLSFLEPSVAVWVMDPKLKVIVFASPVIVVEPVYYRVWYPLSLSFLVATLYFFIRFDYLNNFFAKWILALFSSEVYGGEVDYFFFFLSIDARIC